MTKFKPLACELHAHADSSLDGGSTVEAKVKRAKELGYASSCLTDHGVLNGLAAQWKACKKHNIKCIQGFEAYIQDPFRPVIINAKGKEQKQYAHLTIHFKTKEAYKYFCQLTPKMEERAVIKYGERKPILLLEELEEISGQITIGSGCTVGAISKYLRDGEVEKSIQMYERLRSLAGPGNFFCEVLPHIVDTTWERAEYAKDKTLIKPGRFVKHECADDGLPLDLQKRPNQFILEMARKYGDPIAISSDSHFATHEDQVVQSARLGNGQERWKFYNSLHMLTSEEAAETLKAQLGISDRDVEEFIDNSYQFLEQFNNYTFETGEDKLYLPKMEDIYEIKTPTSTKEKLKDLVAKHGKFPKPDHPRYKEYVDRYDQEVAVLADNGTCDFLPYFFVLEDVCSFCKKEGVLFNARGSAGGSLILFLLGCSITDPIKHNLSFARFMTLGRIRSRNWPDVDMDFSDQEKVFAYFDQKYGDKFIRISISKPLKVKSSIKDIEREMFGAVRQETEKMCVAIPQIPQGISDKMWLFGYEDETTGEHVDGFIELGTSEAKALQEYRDANPEIWKAVLKCLGVEREKSLHACSGVIASEPVQNIMPVTYISGVRCTGFGPKEVEYKGCIKFDFLGVKMLKAIENTLKFINAKRPPDQQIVWEEFAEDPRAYKEIIQAGKLKGLFQINTDSMRPFVNKLKPKCVDDLSNLIALVRPGALDAAPPNPEHILTGKYKNAADYFTACANGEEVPYYIHPSLEPILKSTFGVCLMQESQISIAKMILDINDEQADSVRRACGKKDKQLMMQKSKEIIEGCLKKGWSKPQADQMADVFMAASRYSFNCIGESQKIYTKAGPKTTLEILNDSSLEVSYRNEEGSIEFERPSFVGATGVKDVYRFHLDDGRYIEATADHKVLTEKGWMSLMEASSSQVEILNMFL